MSVNLKYHGNKKCVFFRYISFNHFLMNWFNFVSLIEFTCEAFLVIIVSKYQKQSINRAQVLVFIGILNITFSLINSYIDELYVFKIVYSMLVFVIYIVHFMVSFIEAPYEVNGNMQYHLAIRLLDYLILICNILEIFVLSFGIILKYICIILHAVNIKSKSGFI